MATFLAFSTEQVHRLTLLSMRQLTYWDQIGFFRPRHTDEVRRRAFGRVYSFKNVVGLRTLAILRNKHGIPLQELKKVGAWLSARYDDDDPWASLKFYVSGGHVYFQEPVQGAYMSGRSLGQFAFPFLLQEVEREVERAARKLQEREPSEIGSIVKNRYVVSNAPVLAGTRIPISAVWDLHHAGYDTEGIIREYPRLTPRDVRAAIEGESMRGKKRAV